MALEYVPYAGPVVTRAEALAAGMPRFFTGMPCRRQHVSQRMTKNEGCYHCAAEWKAANRDRLNAAEREARVREPEAYRARIARYVSSEKGQEKRRAYYQANAETIRQRTREWAGQNPDLARENRQAWYFANKEAAKQRTRDWNAANPEAARARSRNYRARQHAAEGCHSAADVAELFAKQGGRCIYCRKRLGDSYHVDHIQPLSKGGSNWPSNLQLACAACNNRKRATDPIAFAQRLGRLL